MAFASHRPSMSSRALQLAPTLATLTAALMLGACGQTLNPAGGGDLLSIGGSNPSAQQAQTAQAAAQPAGAGDADDLQKATDYWGKQYAENPRDLKTALSYARNLKAMGEKRRALAVFQQAGVFHGNSRELASEYGRLALDLDQIQVAKKLLAFADDPAKPDWRVISARGAAFAKEGSYNEAIPLFEKALSLAHNQPSVMSNLALAYAMNGEPKRAESMLRQAATSDNNSPRIRQNLALVLGLQGKYDEAKLVAARDMPMTNATDNADYLRQVVKLDPKSVPNSDPLPAEWNTEANIAEAPALTAVPVQKVADVQPMPPVDAMAVHETAWVVTRETSIVPMASKAEAAPAAAEPAKVISVSEMAAQFATAEDQALAAKPKKTPAASTSSSWSPQIAQGKR